MAPMMLMMVTMSLYSIIDGFFVSNYAGKTAFAALNIIWPAIQILAAFGLMIGSGGSALVSKTLGEGDTKRADEIFTMLVKIEILGGFLLSAVAFVYMPQLANALGAEGDMVEYAVSYGRIVVAVLPLQIIQLSFQSFFMTACRPQTGFISTLLSGLINIVFDIVFILWLGWGLAGAAIATAMGMTFGGVFAIVYIFKGKSELHFVRCKLDTKSIIKACTNGLSEYVGNVSLSIVGICYNLQLMRFIGENGVDAYGIIMYEGFIFAAIFIGFNIGVTPVIGYNYGAHNTAELKSLLRKCLLMAVSFGFVLTMVAELSAPIIAHVFVGFDAELESLTIHATRVYMVCFLITGVNMFTSAWFTSLNNGVVSAVLSFTRTLCFELGFVLYLPYVFGVDGIWYSVTVAEFFAAILSFLLLVTFRRKYNY